MSGNNIPVSGEHQKTADSLKDLADLVQAEDGDENPPSPDDEYNQRMAKAFSPEARPDMVRQSDDVEDANVVEDQEQTSLNLPEDFFETTSGMGGKGNRLQVSIFGSVCLKCPEFNKNLPPDTKIERTVRVKKNGKLIRKTKLMAATDLACHPARNPSGDLCPAQYVVIVEAGAYRRNLSMLKEAMEKAETPRERMSVLANMDSYASKSNWTEEQYAEAQRILTAMMAAT